MHRRGRRIPAMYIGSEWLLSTRWPCRPHGRAIGGGDPCLGNRAGYLDTGRTALIVRARSSASAVPLLHVPRRHKRGNSRSFTLTHAPRPAQQVRAMPTATITVRCVDVSSSESLRLRTAGRQLAPPTFRLSRRALIAYTLVRRRQRYTNGRRRSNALIIR
jgi:hypothetical protein